MINVSASQLDTYKLCARKWAFGYLDGIKMPPTRSLLDGSAYHALAEHYLLHAEVLRARPPHFDGEEPVTPWARIADWVYPAIAHMPQPGSVIVEKPFEFALSVRMQEGYATTALYRGRIDMLGAGWVGDHKTTSDPRWAKTALENDIQAIIYAFVLAADPALREWSPSDAVRLRWIYSVTRGTPQSFPVDCTLTRAEITSAHERLVLPIVRDLIRTRREHTSAATVPPNPDACSAYGGCPHIDRCQLSQREKITALFRQEPNMPLPQAMLEELAAQGAQAVNPPAAVTADPRLPAEVIARWSEYPAEQQAAWLASLPPVAAPVPPPPPVAAPVAAPVPPPPPVAAPVAAPPPPPVAAPVAAPPPPPVAAPVAAPQPLPVAAPVATEKRGRGRPKTGEAITAQMVPFWCAVYAARIAAGGSSDYATESAEQAMTDYNARHRAGA